MQHFLYWLGWALSLLIAWRLSELWFPDSLIPAFFMGGAASVIWDIVFFMIVGIEDDE